MMVHDRSLQFLEGCAQAIYHIAWVIKALNLFDFADSINVRYLRPIIITKLRPC